MRVILLDNVKGVGRIGDVKDVNDGYARNFLFPRRLGKPASSGAVKEAELLKSRRLESAEMGRTHARELAQKLHGATIVMHGKANEKGTLFSAIPRTAVAEKISETAGVRIDPDHIRSDDHLKTLGPHAVHLRLADGVTADLTVDIR